MLTLRQPAHAALMLTGLAAGSCPAWGQVRRFDVPAGPLPTAIVALGRQSGSTVVTSDAAALRVRVPGVRGAMTVEAALQALLKGTDFEGVRLNAATFVVRRRSPPPLEPSHRAAPPPPVEHGPDILVTATKIREPLAAFSGTAHVVSLDAPGLRRAQGRGTAAIIDQLPIMASTGLGPGRDKLFVRGIADSSFSGPTQATVGQYLGEIRLNYNAPDPSLALYDLSSVEVLEGPQATLYGAGSLGGILRLVPHAPVAGRWEGSVSSAISLAANGRIGSDVAGVINVPLGERVTTRLVGYANTVPGPVDDYGRGLRAVGRYRTIGGRAAIAASFGDDWSMELTGTYQRIDYADARYAQGTRNPPARESAIPQPAGNTFALGGITVRKAWDSGLELVSSSSFVNNELRARYDLSTLAPEVANVSLNHATVMSHETRLSRKVGRGSWLMGFHVMRSTDRLGTRLTSDSAVFNGIEVGNGVVDAALFGQATFPLTRRWSATIGGRLSYAEVRSFGRLPDTFDATRLSVLGGGTARVLPSVALGWHPRSGVTAYARYQRGYRVGGLAIQPYADPLENLPDFTVNVFRPDSLDMIETGVRFGRTGASPLSGTIAISATHWNAIQADLFSIYGPYTANIGDGRIHGLEASVGWRATRTLTLSAATFLAQSTLYRDETVSHRARREWLPNIPFATARLDSEWRTTVGAGELMLGGRMRYVGLSRLGIGDDLPIRQGNYMEIGVGAELTRNGRLMFIDVDNLFNVRGNRFALGNPFTAIAGNQRTPLQPRTVRVGVRVPFQER